MTSHVYIIRDDFATNSKLFSGNMNAPIFFLVSQTLKVRRGAVHAWCRVVFFNRPIWIELWRKVFLSHFYKFGLLMSHGKKLKIFCGIFPYEQLWYNGVDYTRIISLVVLLLMTPSNFSKFIEFLFLRLKLIEFVRGSSTWSSDGNYCLSLASIVSLPNLSKSHILWPKRESHLFLQMLMYTF